MYSYEIQQALESNNYKINTETYSNICSSPQIERVKYSPFGDYFELWTTDGGYWKFSVY